MLNTQKLLYILPDVAYVTELLPAKKPNTFSIQSFRQINGEFMDDEVFISQNIQKLFSKLEEGEYHLVLPDFLFTNTILNVTETTDSKVKEYINEKLLPKLDLNTETHELQTFVLTEFKGVSKVQLSAVEKSLLAPLRVASNQNKVEISGLSPLSWTIKSEVSLEPSISVLQIGAQLYAALQYIGVDQATITPVSETDAVAETIKTLQGAEPNIQTVYLLTNAKVEEELKELVSKTLPLQQLTSSKDDDAKMPSYVKQIIESGMRTLSIEDYPVPKFSLGKATKDEVQEFSVAAVEDIDDDEDLLADVDDDKKDEKTEEKIETESETEPELPAPFMPSIPTIEAGATTSAIDEPDSNETEEEENMPKDKASEDKKSVVEPIEAFETVEAAEDEPIKFKPVETTETDETEKSKPEVKAEAVESTKTEETPETTETKDEDIDLSQFASHSPAAMTSELDKPEIKPDEAIVTKKKEVIKNSSGIGNMLKMVFITLAVFAITVAVGVGAGLTLISMNSKDKDTPTPTPVAEIQSTPEPTTDASASPSATIKPEEINVLIVNATTKAGYAGTFKASLDEAGYGQVRAANARGEYDEGTYILMPEENSDLITQLAKDAKLELDFAEGYLTEDPSKQYDAVIVLAK